METRRVARLADLFHFFARPKQLNCAINGIYKGKRYTFQAFQRAKSLKVGKKKTARLKSEKEERKKRRKKEPQANMLVMR